MIKGLLYVSKMQTYRRLVFIGNGFDRTHGYKTTYQDFINFKGEDFFEKYRSYLKDYKCDNEQWSDFEDRICELTAQMYAFLYATEEDQQKADDDIIRVNEEFATIRNELIEYLHKETSSRKVKKLSSIKKYLTRKSLILNFNYTNIAKAYTDNIHHVHGSLAENNIVLGYDYRDEACLATYDIQKWSKNILRELLGFSRYVKRRFCCHNSSGFYARIMDEYEAVVDYTRSPRGYEEEEIAHFEFKEIIQEYLVSPLRRESQSIPSFNYSGIREVVVMGHGIVADQVFLSSILKRCRNIEKVIIFSYNGESADEWEKKAAFFRPYCKKIRKLYY